MRPLCSYCNEAALSLLAEWKSGIGEYMPDEWRSLIRASFDSKQKSTVKEIKFKDQFFSFMIAPVADTDYANLYARDITERIQAQQALQKHSERLEEMVEDRTKQLRDAQEEMIRKEKFATLGKLSGSIAHELRNPLGVIDSSVFYLKKKLKDADE